MKKLILVAILLIVAACKSDKKQNTSHPEQNDKNDNYVIPSSEENGSESTLGKSMERGKKIYGGLCVTCHLPSGKGIPDTYPPLDGSNWLTEKREESIHAVKYGLKGEITVNGKTYDNVMTPMGLSDREVADVLNYVMNSWGNKSKNPVTPEEVSAIAK